MNLEPLRVAIVSREYPPFFGGGIGTYVRWIVPALAQAGVCVHVITEAHDRTQARVEIDGLITTHRVPVGVGRGGWTNAAARFSINAGRKLFQLWRSGQVDIAEFAECEAAGLAPLLFRQSCRRIPVIVQLHTPSEQLFVLRSLSSRTLNPSLISYFHGERLAIRLADEVLAPSQFIASWAHGHYSLNQCPTVIPYATGDLPPAPASPQVGLPLQVFYAGRIEPRKGVESLLRGWVGVLKKHPDAKLHLAGADTSGAPDGGSMRAYLLEQLGESSKGSVKFLGRLGPEAMRSEYARANLCVIPSLWENFPNTCIESMSNARAVLVGDEGGMQEMIGSTQAGVTFQAGNQDDLCQKLCSMLDEGPLALARRGDEGRRRIEYMCDPVRVGRLRIAHYQRIIESVQRQSLASQADVKACKDAWVGFEQVASGASSSLDLPKLSPIVGQWVDRMEVSLC